MIPNAHCKKHDEMEPQDNDGFWACPKCSQESIKKIAIAIEDSKELPFWTLPIKESK